MTPVIYRKWRDTGDVIALFPTHPGTYEPSTCSSYMQLGQHAAADLRGVIRVTRPATRREARDIHRELRRVGYTDLRVMHRVSRKMDITRLMLGIAAYDNEHTTQGE